MKRIEEGMVIKLDDNITVDWNNPHKTKGFPVWANAFLVGHIPYHHCSWFNPVVNAIRNKDVKVREVDQIVLADLHEMKWTIKVLWTSVEEFYSFSNDMQHQILNSVMNTFIEKSSDIEEY